MLTQSFPNGCIRKLYFVDLLFQKKKKKIIKKIKNKKKLINFIFCRNQVVIEFIEWLRKYNESTGKELKDKVGVFGMDIYSIFESIDEVLNYLQNVVLDEQGYLILFYFILFIFIFYFILFLFYFQDITWQKLISHKS